MKSCTHENNPLYIISLEERLCVVDWLLWVDNGRTNIDRQWQSPTKIGYLHPPLSQLSRGIIAFSRKEGMQENA